MNLFLNVFGRYAYHSILMIAHSIIVCLNQGGKISFAEQSGALSIVRGSKSELAAVKVVEEVASTGGPSH